MPTTSGRTPSTLNQTLGIDTAAQEPVKLSAAMPKKPRYCPATTLLIGTRPAKNKVKSTRSSIFVSANVTTLARMTAGREFTG